MAAEVGEGPAGCLQETSLLHFCSSALFLQAGGAMAAKISRRQLSKQCLQELTVFLPELLLSHIAPASRQSRRSLQQPLLLS
jgi:hypothetical protein